MLDHVSTRAYDTLVSLQRDVVLLLLLLKLCEGDKLVLAVAEEGLLPGLLAVLEKANRLGLDEVGRALRVQGHQAAKCPCQVADGKRVLLVQQVK